MPVAGIPGDEVAHVAMAVGRRIHGQRRTDIGLAGRVAARGTARSPCRRGWSARRTGSVSGEKAAGCWSLVPSAAGQMPFEFTSSPLLVGRVLGHDLRTAVGRAVLVHVDAGGPVHRRIVLLGHQQFAVRRGRACSQAVAVEVDEGLAVLAADLLVGQDHLVDAVIVPFVMRGHLVDPLGHAGIGVAGEDRHRPAIVARPLLRVPGRGIARAVIDQVELRIVGVPAPGGAAADLPLVALPGVGAGILARPACRDRWSSAGRSACRCRGPSNSRARPACRP